jgi:hypothetical protein
MKSISDNLHQTIKLRGVSNRSEWVDWQIFPFPWDTVLGCNL